MSDYMLRDAVERALMTYDPIRESENDINIDVQGPAVVLNGYVRTDVMRSVATQLARNVRGVRTVQNNLHSDTQLEIITGQMIAMQLGTLAVPFMPMVRVIMGRCFLRGPVASEKAKALIGETAERAFGIVQVRNDLEVDPGAIERLIAPKKAARAAKGGAAGAAGAMVGGKPVTADDLPAWAMKDKSTWGMAEYKARAKAKQAFKRSEGPDPLEMEAAGTILRGGAVTEAEPEPVAVAAPVEAAPAETVEVEETPVAAAPVAVDMGALQAQFPGWALKPKEEWAPDDFKAQVAAKRAFKGGQGEDPTVTIEKAQAALTAAQSAGKPQAKRASGDPREAALAMVRQQFPNWAIVQRKEWVAADFAEAADARVAELQGKGPSTKELQQSAKSALEAALRGEAVGGAGMAKRRDLTADEIAAVRAGLSSQFPGWALKPKEEWDGDDFKAQVAAKRAAKTGAGEAPDTIIAQAQAALTEALKAAHEALPLEGGAPAPAAAPVAAGPRTITPELLEKYPGWALKPKEEWDPKDFQGHAKAKSRSKKGDGPDPESVIAEAQAALG